MFAAIFPVYSKCMFSLFRFARRLGGSSNVAVYRLASDLYKALIDSLMCLSYSIVAIINVYQFRSCCSSCFVVCCMLLACYRLTEVMTVSILISFDRDYKIQRADRAIVNTLWHYLEIAMSFALLYSCLVYFDPNAICGDGQRSLGAEFFAPIYFSVVTLFTVGYGDFAPGSAQGIAMCLVSLELFCGVFILLVVLQRSFGGQIEE